MTKFLCIISVVVFLFASFSALGGTRTYTFDKPDGWEAISGKFEVKNKEFYFTTPAGAGPLMGFALLKEEEGVDTKDVERIEVRGQDQNGPGAKNLAIFFGYDPDAGYAYFAGPFVGGMQKWIFAKMSIPAHEWMNGRGSSIVNAPDKLGTKIWYKIRLIFKKDSVTLLGSEEGKPMKERVTLDFDKGKPKGRVGLGGCDCLNKFDDFVVSGIGVPSLSVEPLPLSSAIVWGALKSNLVTP